MDVSSLNMKKNLTYIPPEQVFKLHIVKIALEIQHIRKC